MTKIQVNDVVQFNSNHEYKGCLGVVKSIEIAKRVKYYEIVIQIPEAGSEFAIATRKEITKVGSLKE